MNIIWTSNYPDEFESVNGDTLVVKIKITKTKGHVNFHTRCELKGRQTECVTF